MRFLASAAVPPNRGEGFSKSLTHVFTVDGLHHRHPGIRRRLIAAVHQRVGDALQQQSEGPRMVGGPNRLLSDLAAPRHSPLCDLLAVLINAAVVALARMLSIIMHRIWVDGTDFRWTREVAAA